MPTIRQKIISLLSEDEMSAREISGEVGISEKEVTEHLAHIARSVSSQDKKVVITPANCLACGYVFEDRKRFTRPGRCPNLTSRVRDSTFVKLATDPSSLWRATPRQAPHRRTLLNS